MLIIILLVVAAIMNAAMDRMSWDFSTSFARKWNPKFWNPNVSYEFAKKLPIIGYRLDGWHIMKTIMLWCMYIASVIILIENYPLFGGAVDFIIYFLAIGVLWSTVFSLFFNVILKRKNEE